MSKPISADKRKLILEGNLIQAILMLAIPVMLNSFIQSMYNLTDTFWLGKIGTASQAAITLVSPVFACICSNMCRNMLDCHTWYSKMAWS